MNIKLVILFYLCVSIYKFFLDLSYSTYVTKIFQYSGFILEFSYKNYILSNLICVFLILFVPYDFKKISDWFLNFFYLIVIMPIASMYGLNKNLSISVLIMNGGVLLIIYFILKVKQIKVITLKKTKRGESIFLFLCFFMIIYLFIWYVLTGAIYNFNLDFSKVYDFREINSELTNIGLASYINNWVYQVFSLALMGYGFLKKNYLIIAFSVFSQIIFFGVSAHKAVLFSIFMIFGLYYYFKITKSLIIVPIFLSLLIFLSLIIFYYDNYSIYPSISIRRFIFVPAQLSYAYYDFFQNNPYDLWAKSILSRFNDSNYIESLPKTIGYYLGTESSANNGFISSGYAQAGYFGVILYAFIAGFILKNIDHLGSNNSYPLWFSLLIVINPLKNLLLSSDLFTVLLTHGLLVSMILMFLLNRSIKVR